MANRLPLELWTHIARYLEADVASFLRYARICRHSQSMFERLMYNTVRVRSEDFETEKGILSLAQFSELTSGTGYSRRALIRKLNYTIIIPYEL
jgi:hypothetical protein